MGREMRPSLPFVCKSCRTKNKQAASDRNGGVEPRSSPSVVPSSANGRDRREPPSEPELAKPSSGRASARDYGLSGDLLESTLPGAGIQREGELAGGSERRAVAVPVVRGRGLTLAERIAQQDLGDEPGSSPRARPLDALDAAAEASLEHAVVTPDGGLGRRDILMRSRTFAGVPRDDARRGSVAPSTGRSPSALPPADSDPVSIQDLAQMLSPGVEPPSLSFGQDGAEDERASRPAPAPAPAPRASAHTPVPVRPPARREHRTATATVRPRSATAPRASASPRPVAPPSEMPPAPLSEMPPAPLSIDEGRPSSHRSSPELRLQDVQAMAALAPQPLPSARRPRSGPGAIPADSSPADLALLGSLAPPPATVPPRAAEEPRRERARPRAAEARGPAEDLREQRNDDRPSREPPARASNAPRVAARASSDAAPGPSADRISQTDLRGRAGRKEDSGLIDLRSMAPPPGAEDGERRNELRADEEVLSISGGLFDSVVEGPLPDEPAEPEFLLSAEGHTASGEETPVRTSITAGSLVSEGRRALSTPAARQYLEIAGWVAVVFVVFGAALYFAQARGRSASAPAQVAATGSSGAVAAAPPEEAAPPAAPAPAGQAADREPSLDDEPVADPPAAAPGVAEQAPAAPASAIPTGEQAAPPPEPAQAGPALAAAPEPTPAPAAPPAPPASVPAAPPAPAAAGAGSQPSDGPQAAEKPARAAAPSAPDRAKPAAKQPAPTQLLPARDEPARFDQSAASSALASAAAAAAGCTGEGLTGTARVAVTFSPSGKAMSSRVEGGDLVGTATAACIAAAFRSATVPPFEGIPVTVMKQVKIR
ncbi:hypothetical protein [Sorangium sp. So ce1389]|uniref:hypothetical protein n=1 Tax=Sorangium sp. So ce1389 TaxID=3133336 RepID=UPI003F6249ED